MSRESADISAVCKAEMRTRELANTMQGCHPQAVFPLLVFRELHPGGPRVVILGRGSAELMRLWQGDAAPDVSETVSCPVDAKQQS